MIAAERSGPRGATPLLLVHAGVADRRMWDPLWAGLTAERDVVRVDLRGFGASDERPAGALDPVADVLAALAEQSIAVAHVVGVSFGAGVAVELALTRPPAVASLLLAAPGGALLAEMTPGLEAFLTAEGAALEAGDLDAAVEANLTTWVDGPRRAPGTVAAPVRELVAAMQRRAFEIQLPWGEELEEAELEPPALERLGELRVPTLVLDGELDLDTVHDAAQHAVDGIPGARRIQWPGVAHMLTLERPDAFAALLVDWLVEAEGAR